MAKTIEADYQLRFFIGKYLKEFVATPKEPMSKKQFTSLLFARFGEIPIVGTLWMFSKIPFIGTRIERIFAIKMAQKWSFKPLPNLEALSQEALRFKKEKTIEINKKIDAETKILDITTFNEIVEKFPFSSVSECGCRSVNMRCDAPKHTCLTMRWPSDVSNTIHDSSKYKTATHEELQRVIDLSDKHSLVHMAINYPDEEHTYVVCNCCDCCCISFREFKTHAVPLIVGSKYVAKIDASKCNGCYKCINFRCRFGAILKINEDGTIVDPLIEEKKRFRLKWPLWSERRNGWGLRIRKDPPSWQKVKSQHKGKWYAKINPDRCFGCGNCTSSKYGCPNGAIQLYPRS